MIIDGWPYAITVNGDVQSAPTATVTVNFTRTPSNETLGQVRYAIESFAALAQAGGLGGDRVDPLQSTATFSATQPPAGGAKYSWEFKPIAIDVCSLTVLFNMLALLGQGIGDVSVHAQGSGPGASFTTDDFPSMWSAIPFMIDDDRADPNIELQIEFMHDITGPESEAIIEAVEIWLDCGLVQGYRDWSAPDDKSFLIPAADPPFTISGSTLTGYLHDDGVIEGCYNILINLLIKLHATTPIRSLEII